MLRCCMPDLGRPSALCCMHVPGNDGFVCRVHRLLEKTLDQVFRPRHTLLQWGQVLVWLFQRSSSRRFCSGSGSPGREGTCPEPAHGTSPPC